MMWRGSANTTSSMQMMAPSESEIISTRLASVGLKCMSSWLEIHCGTNPASAPASTPQLPNHVACSELRASIITTAPKVRMAGCDTSRPLAVAASATAEAIMGSHTPKPMLR